MSTTAWIRKSNVDISFGVIRNHMELNSDCGGVGNTEKLGWSNVLPKRNSAKHHFQCYGRTSQRLPSSFSLPTKWENICCHLRSNVPSASLPSQPRQAKLFIMARYSFHHNYHYICRTNALLLESWETRIFKYIYCFIRGFSNCVCLMHVCHSKLI